MVYENGNIIEINNGKRYFIYNQLDQDSRKFLLLVNLDNNDDISIYELLNRNNKAVIETVSDEKFEVELAMKFEDLEAAF